MIGWEVNSFGYGTRLNVVFAARYWLELLRYKRTFIQRYLASRGSPCADEQGHWQPTEPVWSFLQCWQSSDSGSQTENRARGSQTLTTAGSTFHCLCEDKRAALEYNINKYGKKKKKKDECGALFQTFVVSGDESQDVFVAEHDRLIDLCFPKPGPLLSGGEDLHRYVSAPPASSPHLSETTFTDDFLEDNRSGHSSLDKQRQACTHTQNKCGYINRINAPSFCRFSFCPACTHQSLSQTWTGHIWDLAEICLWLGRGGHTRDPLPPAFACGYSFAGGIDRETNPPSAARKARTAGLRSQRWIPPVPTSHQDHNLLQVLA